MPGSRALNAASGCAPVCKTISSYAGFSLFVQLWEPLRGSPRRLRLEEGKRMAIEETRLFAPVPGLPPRPGTLGAFAPSTALSLNRVRPTVRAVRDTERTADGIGRALSAGVAGENSP